MIRRSETELWSPPVIVDFMYRDWNGNLRLDLPGTLRDVERWGLTLIDGMKLVLFEEDQDLAGEPDDLIGVGVAIFDHEEGRWVAQDWEATIHYSELTSESKALYDVLRPKQGSWRLAD
jgi:hypothetical protein